MSREGRVGGLVRMGTNSTAARRAPAWINVSERVGIAAQHHRAQRRIAGEGAKAAGGVRDGDGRRLGDDPTAQPLERALERREMRHRMHAPIANHDLGPARHDGGHQPLDILAHILVVGVGVDDDVRTVTQAGLETGDKGPRQPQIARLAHDMVHAQRRGYLCRAVLGAVVDDQNFQFIDAGQGTGQGSQRLRAGCVLRCNRESG